MGAERSAAESGASMSTHTRNAEGGVPNNSITFMAQVSGGKSPLLSPLALVIWNTIRQLTRPQHSPIWRASRWPVVAVEEGAAKKRQFQLRETLLPIPGPASEVTVGLRHSSGPMEL